MWTLCENTTPGYHHYDDAAQVVDCDSGKHQTFAMRPVDEHIELVTVANRRRNVVTVAVEDGVAVTSTPPERPALRVLTGADLFDAQLPTDAESDPQNGPDSD